MNLLKGFASLAACLVLGIACEQKASPVAADRLAVNQPVAVICVKFANLSTTRMPTCQAWVDQLNAEVGAWYNRVSDGRASFRFVLPPLSPGVSAPSGYWFQLRRNSPPPTGNGDFFGVSTFEQDVIPVVDPFLDFTRIDRMIVIDNDPGLGANSTGDYWANPLEYPKLATGAFSTQEGGEERWETSPGTFELKRRISAIQMHEAHDSGSSEIQLTSGVIHHEIGHWNHHPERYGSVALNGSSRDPVTGYSPMGLQWPATYSVHFLGYEQTRMSYVDKAAPPVWVAKGTTRDVDLVWLTLPNAPAGTASMIWVPINGAGSDFAIFQGYTIEARQTDTQSALGDRPLKPGVVVTRIDPVNFSVNQSAWVVDNPSYPNDLFHAALGLADVFQDPSRGVTISVTHTISNGLHVRVSNLIPTADCQPDARITPWNQDYWTPDIWVDSPTNGYNSYASTDGNRDQPALRADPADPVIVNRIYYRIWNDGVVPLQNAKVIVSYTAPGIGQTNWTVLGTAPVSATASGASLSGYFDWIVPDDFNGGEPHACIKVDIQPNGPDLNAANNSAQENIFQFETIHSSPWHARSQTITVTNPDKTQDANIDMDALGLPNGWAIRMLPTHFVLKAGATEKVDFIIYPGGSPDEPSVGYDPGYIGRTKIFARAYYEGATPKQLTLGGVEAWTKLTEPTNGSLSVLKASSGGISLRACLKSNVGPVPSALVAVNYWSGKSSSSIYATTGNDGCASLSAPAILSGSWSARSFYAGQGIYGSSVSQRLTFKVP
jgi:hypothetical protein